MRKIFFILVLLYSINLSAQFTGGFACGDPDAWFDKEIYFYCQNNVTDYFGYGQNLVNVSFVVNDGEDYHFFRYNYTWQYRDVLFIDSRQIELKKGSTVYLFIGEECYGSWMCHTSNPSAIDTIKRIYEMKPKGPTKIKINWNKLLKYLKKLPR